MEKKISGIEEMIKAKGFQVTPQRKTIIKLFVETQGHLNPEEIYRLTRKQGVSISTVYRSINILKKTGIIKEIALHNQLYYELYMYSQKKLHIHFQCEKCGQIKEYSDYHIFEKIIQQRDYVEKAFGDEIKDIMIVMKGICSSCKKSDC